MGVFLSLCLVSALNVGLGYALAVSLGFGPRRLRAAWLALGSDTRSPSPPDPLDQELLATPRKDSSKPPAPTHPSGVNPTGTDESNLAIAEYGGGAT